MEVKVYVVVTPEGQYLGVKLTRAAAQSIARYHAPARVILQSADKESLDDSPLPISASRPFRRTPCDELP